MKSDLIFHVVSRRKWHGLNKHGIYTPEIFKDTDKIECVKAEELRDYLNQEFKGRKNLIILVIDKSRLTFTYYNKLETGRILVEKGINLDAILDKIRIDCEPDGNFDIEFKAN